MYHLSLGRRGDLPPERVAARGREPDPEPHHDRGENASPSAACDASLAVHPERTVTQAPERVSALLPGGSTEHATPLGAGEAPDRALTGAGEATDLAFMQLALEQARNAERLDEVPVGAVLVVDGVVVASAHNLTRTRRDPTAHAELLALSQAAQRLQVPRLVGATLYCTVEPCLMCAGALLHARLERVVWAVRDPKFGGCQSLAQLLDHPRANHRVRQAEGVCAEESRALLQAFFRKKRSDAL